MITVTVDGRDVEVAEGTTVLEAAKKLGINIPTLCHDDRLKPYGACRLCVVEIAGMRKPVTSCTTPATDNMIVKTQSERLYRLRRTAVELLLSDHPNDCMTCIGTGDCRLQELAYQYGIRENRFAGEMRDHHRIDKNPFVVRQQNKCVMCGLCVRVCEEVQGVGAIGFAERGFEAKVIPPFGKDLDCEFCGQCVSVCPTGALSGAIWAGKARMEGVEKTDTTCTYCGCGCNLTLSSNGDQVIRVTSDANNHNRGWLCVKGRFGFDFINSPERLTRPMIRREKGGTLERVSWDEALDFVAERFTKIKKESGADAIGGLCSARCTNEENYIFQKMMRAAIGTNNIDHCARY
ncbi:formate dehydrogenase (NADP) alpha subunit [Desulforhopalus singaporensis]|uniref:Formate dehydrogenase (NADP) alpha subunit n=2 Tax=Desulforhopalus singaporensis TaxID=91360 RepID=A0A1H0TNK1_9BACT|nr:formate dehydrogenase (NADP) alpha subunit [Desulforhopalus singaporensis]